MKTNENWIDKDQNYLGFSIKLEQILTNFNILLFQPTDYFVTIIQSWNLTALNWLIQFRKYIEKIENIIE